MLLEEVGCCCQLAAPLPELQGDLLCSECVGQHVLSNKTQHAHVDVATKQVQQQVAAYTHYIQAELCCAAAKTRC
jgi:hypothetical protein